MLRNDSGEFPATGPMWTTSEQDVSGQFARLRRMVNLSPAAIMETDPADVIRFSNPRWQALRALTGDEEADQTFADLVLPESAASYANAVADLQTGTQQITIELALTRQDGTPFHVSGSLAAIVDADHRFSGITGIFVDITERVAAEAKLRASETRLRQILDNTVALIGVMQPDGTLIEANQPALAAGGLARSDVIGKKFWDCFWWCYDPSIMKELQDAVTLAATGQQVRYDTMVRVENDVLMPLDFMLSPVTDEQGNVELLVPSGLDISDRKRSEEQLAFIMREVNHRSKNMLAVVQSILRQMRPNDVGQFVQDFGARLRALASCQDLLVNSSDDSPDLATLVQTQLTYFANLNADRLRISGPTLRVSSDVAQGLGMAIYELATNAGKYGALSNTTGQIDIVWKITDGADGKIFDLRWEEHGGPKVVPPERTGFGSVVLEDMLAMSLGAQTEVIFAPDGLVWTLTCPAAAMLNSDREPAPVRKPAQP